MVGYSKTGFAAAQYVYDMVKVDGIVAPTKRMIWADMPVVRVHEQCLRGRFAVYC